MLEILKTISYFTAWCQVEILLLEVKFKKNFINDSNFLLNYFIALKTMVRERKIMPAILN